jgi:hypothetical protein
MRMREKFYLRAYWWMIFMLLAAACPAAAQDRPLLSPDADIVPPGTLRVEAGFDFLQDVSYPLSGLSGDQTNLGVLDLRLGLGKIVEGELTGTVQSFLQIDSQGTSYVGLALPSANSTHDVGDFSLLTKIRILDEGDRHPALAFRFGVTMPNTNQALGIGNNSINVLSDAIMERHFGRLETYGSIGLAILTAPNAKTSQNDEARYGLAASYPLTKSLNLVSEVAGQQNTRPFGPSLVGTESRGQGRLGVQLVVGGFEWDAAAIAGIYRNDPHTGLTFGVSHDFQVFNRARTQ